MAIKNQKSKTELPMEAKVKKRTKSSSPIKNQKYNLKVKNIKPEVRYLNDMKDVLYDKKWFKKMENFPVYYVWRGVKKENGLRYDIIIIPPKMLGQEFPKTKGHKHINNFQELIKVLEGKGFYFVQKSKRNSIEDCYVIEAKKGDFVIIPVGYDHLTINPANKKLIMANWISKKCKSDYKSIEKTGGACYYYTKKGWIKNKNYDIVPKLHFEKPLKKLPKNLDFLK